MIGAGIDVILLNYSRSIFYYAGTTQPSLLIITPDDYHLSVIKGMDSVMEETWFESSQLSPSVGYEDAKERLKKWKIGRGHLGMEMDILPTSLYLRVSEMLPQLVMTDASELILEQRKIKDAKEVEDTKESCRIAHQGHTRILGSLREGMNELKLSSEIEYAHRRAGHEGHCFIRRFNNVIGRGPVASGENLSKIAGHFQSVTGVGLSHSLPFCASQKQIKKGEMIVVDIPTHFHGYHCDQSRTYVLGKAPDVCKSLYQRMQEIADRTIKALTPGIRCDHAYKVSLGFAAELHMEPFFQRLGVKRKMVPFIGHGVGLELNEPPWLSQNSKETIEEGTIFTLELEMTSGPGEVVKLEDTVLMGSEGVEILTLTPRGLHEI